MKSTFLLFFIIFSVKGNAQKIDSIYFHLYTDSLKKGIHNYINVDGLKSNGSYVPLMDDEVIFKSSFGIWEGNNLIIDTAFKEEKITIIASLKKNTAITKTITVFIKKINTEPLLKSEKEVMEQYKKRKKSESRIIQ